MIFLAKSSNEIRLSLSVTAINVRAEPVASADEREIASSRDKAPSAFLVLVNGSIHPVEIMSAHWRT